MPTSISIANLEVALGNCYDAITSRDWSSADYYAAQYAVQYMGVPNAAIAGASSNYPAPDTLMQFLAAAKLEYRSKAGGRLIRTRTNYHG